MTQPDDTTPEIFSDGVFFPSLIRRTADEWQELFAAMAAPREPKPRDEKIERGTASQAAAITGLKQRKLQAMAQRGEIPGAAKLRRQWTFDLAKLRRFVEQQERATTCQSSAKPRPGATGGGEFYGVKFKSAGSASGGRLKQMIQ